MFSQDQNKGNKHANFWEDKRILDCQTSCIFRDVSHALEEKYRSIVSKKFIRSMVRILTLYLVESIYINQPQQRNCKMNSEIKIEDEQPRGYKKVETFQHTTLRGPLKQEILAKKLVNKKQDDFSQNQRKEKWSNTENRRYITFLKKNSALFELSYQERRKAKINVKMSRLVKTKNPSQCHSHHQKMMLKYGSLEAIIEQNLHLTSETVGMFKKKIILKVNEDQIKEVQAVPKAYTEQNEYYERLNEDQWLQFLENSVFQKPKSLFDLLKE